nr:uncharacterized protein LOC111416181 [Onthophagus taurus]
MFSFSASGLTCAPLIIYPCKRIPEKISQTVKDPDWGIGRSDNGWMTAETFYYYVKNVFHRFLVKNNIQFPVLLFLDGHKSHLTYELSLLYNELNIEVIALYPNANRILQPCDVAVFRPIKMRWKRAVREFYEQNPGEVLYKMTFAPLLEKVLANNIKRDILINGFRACGLFPFNPDAIDYTKCLGNKNERPEIKMPPPCMDHRTYVSLTGEDLLKRIKSFDDLLIKEGITEEFLTLYKIWSYFEKPDSLPNDKKDDLDMIDVPGSFNNQVLKLTEAEPELDTSENQPSSAPQIKINLDAELNSSEDQLSKEPKINITHNIVIKPGKDSILSLPSTSKNMGDYLVVPEKPSRKNKRNIERVSFAITSREYQESFEKKRAIKLELENKKLERKRKREESAAAKALKKTTRKNIMNMFLKKETDDDDISEIESEEGIKTDDQIKPDSKMCE